MLNDTDDLVDDFIDAVVVVADTRDPYSGHLPQVVVINLRYGDVELLLKTGGEGLDYTTLVLERLAPRDMDLQSADANVHENPICRTGTINL